MKKEMTIILGLVILGLALSMVSAAVITGSKNQTTNNTKDTGLTFNPIIRINENTSLNNTNTTNSTIIPTLNISNPIVKKGDVIHALINTGNNPIDLISLILMSEYKINFLCTFNANGTKISGCDGMGIVKSPTINITTAVVNNTDNSTTNVTTTQIISDYEVDVNTTTLFAGNFTPQLETQSTNQTLNTTGHEITITGDSESLEGCSIRGKDGYVAVENTTFNSLTKINFYIPLNNAAPGEGELTSQKDKTYFSFKFNIVKVLDNNKQSASILVSGQFRTGLEDFKQTTAVILLNKVSKKISIVSNDLTLKDTQISFMSKC